MGDNLFSTSLQLEKAMLTDPELISILDHLNLTSIWRMENGQWNMEDGGWTMAESSLAGYPVDA